MSHRLSWRMAGQVIMLEKLLALLGLESSQSAQLLALLTLSKLLRLLELPTRGMWVLA